MYLPVDTYLGKAYAEGIGNMGPAVSAGGGGSSIMSDMLGLGVGMAAAQTIAPQMGQMFQSMAGGMQNQGMPNPMGGQPVNPMGMQQGMPMMQAQSQVNANPMFAGAGTWNCSCGNTGITGNFCNNCGKKRGE